REGFSPKPSQRAARGAKSFPISFAEGLKPLNAVSLFFDHDVSENSSPGCRKKSTNRTPRAKQPPFQSAVFHFCMFSPFSGTAVETDGITTTESVMIFHRGG